MRLRPARLRDWPTMLVLLALPGRVSSAGEKLRIAYVTNAWWPKVDGAAISVMAHSQYFASQGHPTLVVRPHYEPKSPLVLSASGTKDPCPATENLSFVSFATFGHRGGGFEPEMDPTSFPKVERALAAWLPDVVLIADPDLFLFDAFRLPGFNSISRSATFSPVTIACFTSFAVDAALAMPEFWWMHNPPLRKVFIQGHAIAYASFDHIFLNGRHSYEYVSPHLATSRRPKLTHRPSPLTPHSSPLTLHPSPFTPHPSPLTPHPSPLTPHPSPLRAAPPAW